MYAGPSLKQLLDGEQRRGQAVRQDHQGRGGQGQGGGREGAEEWGMEEHEWLVQAQNDPTLGRYLQSLPTRDHLDRKCEG